MTGGAPSDIWTADKSWNVIQDMCSGGPDDESRLGRRESEIKSLVEVKDILVGRARRIWAFSGMEKHELVETICSVPHAVLTGFSVLRPAVERDSIGRAVECYVRESDFDDISDVLRLEPADGPSDVLLRVVRDDLWIFEEGAICVPAQLAAVDVLDAAGLEYGIDMAARRTSIRLMNSIKQAEC